MSELPALVKLGLFVIGLGWAIAAAGLVVDFLRTPVEPPEVTDRGPAPAVERPEVPWYC